MKTEQKEGHYNLIIKKLSLKFSKEKFTSSKMIYKLVVDQLAKLPHYQWTGIYLLDSKNNELQLDYYFGKPTDHTRIPVGKGVCGSAIAEKTDKIIKDVREEDNYLACSLETRSEIVVLIESEDEIIGQIDVDSDDVGAFDEIDRNYLHKISEMMVKKLKAIE
ncbi:MAG: GAF domain-containing protein [Candidatus Hodarchaeales archaeon]